MINVKPLFFPLSLISYLAHFILSFKPPNRVVIYHESILAAPGAPPEVPAPSPSFYNSGWRGTGAWSLILVLRLSERNNSPCFNFDILVPGRTTALTPPAEGLFFAQPVTVLSSDSESDIDTDDAQTVIFKSSPYSSPGPGSNFITYYM